ncbi:MAG TPA: GxxExxY protein [Acidobacteriota bacterium]|nr:GxxExxY protein [Acidobacteriota bacterium]HOT00016.1 GxxExxY protein [Acidobacteriota bacterium]HQF85653.1 GxxExxY protein [Acidobacteriota bacterium]HQG91103.1 GxxExxY protein [Acidobacteriota bacterium]HQK87544.1 GxxExxY protein [Acidobacteriota bacterium]
MDALNIITGRVLTAAFRVHSALGPGLLESAYQACLAYELHQMRLKADVQVALPVTYDQIRLEVGYRLDIVVEQQVILELKAVNQLLPIHEAQLLSYLKMSGLPVGLLINFHEVRLKDGIRRLINTKPSP